MIQYSIRSKLKTSNPQKSKLKRNEIIKEGNYAYWSLSSHLPEQLKTHQRKAVQKTDKNINLYQMRDSH